MMIRAGVDDRAMLSASGVNVQMVFAITFAIGAGLAGFAGVVGGTALSIAPGEDTRYLLASLVVVIVGGMGSVAGAALGRRADRPRRAVRPRLCADLRRRVHLRDHGAGAGLPAARHPGEARMSAAQWRKAMNFTARQPQLVGRRGRRPHLRPRPTAAAAAVAPASVLQAVASHRTSRHVFVLAAVLVYPWVVPPFFTYQIGGQALILGLIALSLTFLAGYGGMLSLAQMTVAGIAGYIVAILGVSGTPEISLGWPWWLVVVLAVMGGTLARHAHRLAVGAHRGHLHHHDHAGDRHGVLLPGPAELRDLQRLPGLPEGRAAASCSDIDWRAPMPFYYLALFWALAGYFFVKYLIRAPFGVALQGVRDNARRMSALGFSPVAHRVAAYAVAGLIASIGGVLLVWYNGLITPGSVGTSLDDQHPDRRRAGRHAPSHRAVHRRRGVRAAAELRHRPDRSRALQPGDRRACSW